MYVIKAYDFFRNDCTMDLQCEHCGHMDTDKSAYNDEYFRNHVVPDRHCSKCGKDAGGMIKILHVEDHKTHVKAKIIRQDEKEIEVEYRKDGVTWGATLLLNSPLLLFSANAIIKETNK